MRQSAGNARKRKIALIKQASEAICASRGVFAEPCGIVKCSRKATNFAGGEVSSVHLPSFAEMPNAAARRQTPPSGEVFLFAVLATCGFLRLGKRPCLQIGFLPLPAFSSRWHSADLDNTWRKAGGFCGFVETAGGANQEYGTRRLVRGEGNAFPVHTGGRTVWQMNASAKSGGNFYCTLSLLKRGSACQKTFREGEPRRTSVAAGKQ